MSPAISVSPMKIVRFFLASILLAGFLLPACSPALETPSGTSIPDKGWLLTGAAPYTLNTKVDAAPGPARFCLVTDRSLMADAPEIVLETDAVIGADSTLSVPLGALEPGFYQVCMRPAARSASPTPPESTRSISSIWAMAPNLSASTPRPVRTASTCW